MMKESSGAKTREASMPIWQACEVALVCVREKE